MPPIIMTLRYVIERSNNVIETASSLERRSIKSPIIPGSTAPTPPGVGMVLRIAWLRAVIRIKGIPTVISSACTTK